MVLIVTLSVTWLGACMLVAALLTAAARADQPTAEHHAHAAAARNLRVWPAMARPRPTPTRPRARRRPA